MTVNPDIEAERVRNKIIFEDDADRRVPTPGELRFIKRDIRALQQYQWSQEDGKWDWYDIPLVSECLFTTTGEIIK